MKAILITGAYGGMGYPTTQMLARQGFRVFALDKTIRESEENIIPVQADITDEKSVQNALELVRSMENELFAIIHFAGVYMLDSLVEMKSEEFCRIFDINLMGAFLVNKIFLPMLKSGSRILITTSELAPLAPLPFTGIYAVTKGALDKYAYSLRMELQLLGISVSVLRAGAVSTGMLDVSTQALDLFCESTKLYACNAERFKKIVNSVEARSISPQKIAEKVSVILGRDKPAFAYAINRNPLLRMLNALPQCLQLRVIRLILS